MREFWDTAEGQELWAMMDTSGWWDDAEEDEEDEEASIEEGDS